MTDWSQFVAYRCRHCKENCINHVDAERTQYKECAYCFSIPAIEHAPDAEEVDPANRSDLTDEDRRAVESGRWLSVDD
ncbi:MAG: hypothetical protein ABEJ94_04725 [Halorientalis sp.]